MRNARLALLAGIAIALAACAKPPLARLVPADADAPRVRAALAAISSEGADRRALRVVGRLKLESPSQSGSVREVVLVERPGRLRLEALSMLNQTLSLLVVDDSAFAFYDGEQLEHGEVWDGVLFERMGLDFAPEEAVDALLAAPRGVDVAPDAIFAQAEVRVAWIGARRVRIGPNGELLGVEAVDADGVTRWRAEYTEWRTVPGGRYPFELELFFPATELRASLTAKRVELNPDLDPGLFRAGGARR